MKASKMEIRSGRFYCVWLKSLRNFLFAIQRWLFYGMIVAKRNSCGAHPSFLRLNVGAGLGQNCLVHCTAAHIITWTGNSSRPPLNTQNSRVSVGLNMKGSLCKHACALTSQWIPHSLFLKEFQRMRRQPGCEAYHTVRVTFLLF